MINAEYYKEKIKEKIREVFNGGPIAIVDGELFSCYETPCKYCDFFEESGKCERKRIEWLISERAEKPKLTKKEYMLLQDFEFAQKHESATWCAARDKNGHLRFYNGKPRRRCGHWWLPNACPEQIYSSIGVWFEEETPFPFIKWEDVRPWTVEKLLKLEVEE